MHDSQSEGMKVCFEKLGVGTEYRSAGVAGFWSYDCLCMCLCVASKTGHRKIVRFSSVREGRRMEA